VSSDFDYTTWNVGAAYQLTSRLAVDVRYHDTDEHDFGDIYGSRAVASLKASF
jgi:opacity protein-like surface antigen